MKKYYFLILFSLLSVNTAFAAGPITDVSILSTISQAMAPAANKLFNTALIWLTLFSSLQFFVTNFKLLGTDADIGVVFGKLIGTVAWMTICGYLIINGPAFIGSVGQSFFSMVGAGLPSPGSIMASTSILASTLGVLAVAVGVFSNTAGQIVTYLMIFIFCVGMFFAVKIFMVQLELALIVMLAPLSFSFLGLNNLRDQGIAPFKSLISLGYRIVLMTVILAAFTQVSSVVNQTITNISVTNLDGIGNIIETALSGGGAYVMLVYLLYKSDSIAASLANGSTSMGPADMASAAAAGAAAGAAVAATSAAVPGAAGQAVKSVSETMGGLGNGGSIQNASRSGIGGKEPIGSPPVRPASSLSEYVPSDKPPQRPEANSEKTGSSNNSAPVRGQSSDLAGGGVGPSAAADSTAPAGSASDSARRDSSAIPSTNTSSLAPEKPGGDASTAGIGGTGGESGLEKRLGDLVDTMSKPHEKSLKDHLGEVHRHVAQESAATQVSINTHAD